MRLVILRPFNQVGAGQDERFVLPSFAGQIARIEASLVPPVLEVGNLAAERDFLPVGDVVRAYAELIARGVDIADGSVFNVASGRPRSIAACSPMGGDGAGALGPYRSMSSAALSAACPGPRSARSRLNAPTH